MNHRIAIPTLIALLAPLAAEAAAPSLVPVTGYLTDANGLPIDGTVDVDFAIYRTATGGTSQWNNGGQPMSVDVFDGQFTAYLGADAALDLALFRDNTGLFLGMAVDGAAEMTPRFEMGSAPFAGYAKYCDDAYSVGGADITQIRLAADDILWSELSTTTIPAGLDDGDDVGPTYTAGLGIGISANEISADKSMIEGWARFVAFDSQSELTTALNSVYMAKQTCAANQVLMADGAGGWTCTDSTALPLSETVIDGFLANNLALYATNASVTTLTGRVAATETSIGTLQTSVTGINSQISTVNSSLTTLQGQIGGLGTNPGNMIAQYEFDEGTGSTSFADTSGLSNTLAANVGGVGAGSGTAHAGKSVSFSTIEGVFAAANNKIPDSAQIWPEMWLRTGDPSQTYTLLDKQGAYKMRMTASKIEWTVTTTGGTCTVTHSTPVLANTWTQVSGWYDGLNVAVAINGVPLASACSTGRIAPTVGGVMTIGGKLTGTAWSEVFSGNIDEVRIRPTAPYAQQTFYNSQRVFRKAQWSSYDQAYGWMGGNGGNGNANMFLGITPQSWGDGSGMIWSANPDAEFMRTLFNQKIYPGKNAMVAADTWYNYSSTNSRHTGVLMRIRNTTGSPIPWTVTYDYTCRTDWGEYASATLNGASTWQCPGNHGSTQGSQSLTLSIPANRTSTFIVVSGSDVDSGYRTNYLAFINDSLNLPSGLFFVDDLDTVAGSVWTQ